MQSLKRNRRDVTFDIHFDLPPSPWHRNAGRASTVDRLLSYPQALPMSEMVLLLGMLLLAIVAR